MKPDIIPNHIGIWDPPQRLLSPEEFVVPFAELQHLARIY